MALDDYSFDIDSTEWIWNSSEKVSEISEKIKESIKKWTAWIARTKKDEKKAKKYDFLLASFLVKIIVNKKYDSILENIFKTMDFWYSSNFVLWILSLINLEVSDKIRKISWKEKVEFNFKNQNNKDFSDLNPKVKDRINFWIEDIIDVITLDYSNIQNKKNLEILEKDKKVITIFIAQIFHFFLNEVNINIKKEEAINIADYIKEQVKKSMRTLKIDDI